MFDYIDYRIYVLNNHEKIKYYIVSGSLSFLVGYIFYKSFLISFIFMIIPFLFKKSYEDYICKKRKLELTNQFKDMLYTLSSSIASGKQLRESLKESEISLNIIYGEQAYIVRELKEINRRIEVSKEDENKLLIDFANRTGIEDIENFADICTICKKTGADLNNMILKTSTLLTEKMNIEKDIKAIVVQKKYESKIISLMPIFIILFLNVTSPDYLDTMYYTLQGKIIMTLALMVSAFSYKMMERLTEIKI